MSSVAATVPCSSLALDLCPASGEVNICWHERPTVEEKMSYLMIPLQLVACGNTVSDMLD